jgi:predicted dehydrogenase
MSNLGNLPQPPIPDKIFSYGLIGCGLIGEKRAAAIQAIGGRIVGVFDSNHQRANELARQHQSRALHSVNDLLHTPDIDIVVAATPNNLLADYGKRALRSGKHVLLEKPGALNQLEALEVSRTADECQLVAAVGFNHRQHPAMQKAKALMPEIGELMYVRGRYGHGGRLGYEKEWRANPQVSGGGELIDQGTHLIDLAWWYLGELRLRHATLTQSFWNMPVEDNCFLNLETTSGTKLAWLHASCSEWKNMFCLEIYGRQGKMQIDGLGGSYGPEKLTLYRMYPEMGPPLAASWEFPPGDLSWQHELVSLECDIQDGGHRVPRISHAANLLAITDEIYGNPANHLP